jgi:hypothetical protein
VGVIESVGGHSDGEEEGEEAETLERGKARVSWYKRTDNPQTIDVDDLEVVDRCAICLVLALVLILWRACASASLHAGQLLCP